MAPTTTSTYGIDHELRNRPKGGSGWGWGAAIALALLAILAAAIWAWTDDDESAGPEIGVTVEGITEDDAFDDDGFDEGLIGQTVTVSGEVTDVLGPDRFQIAGDDGLYGGDGLLVLSTNRASGIEDGQVVRVTGTVREFDINAFNEEFGWDLGADEFSTYSDENVLVASSVQPLASG